VGSWSTLLSICFPQKRLKTLSRLFERVFFCFFSKEFKLGHFCSRDFQKKNLNFCLRANPPSLLSSRVRALGGQLENLRMSQELTIGYFPTANELDTMRNLAGILIKSGMIPQTIKTPEQAIVILLKSRELRLPPMQAFSSIAVVSGRPVLTAEVMLALIYRDFPKGVIEFVESSLERCVIKASRNGQNFSTFSFSMEDAKRAGLLGKGPWQQYPAAMMRARAISAMARAVFPDALAGCVYTPEELGAEVDEAGEIKNVVSEQAPVPPIQTEKPKSTALVPEVVPQAQPTSQTAPGGDLRAVIERAKAGGPPKPKEPTGPLSWPEGKPLPTCMAALVPFGKLKGTALTDLKLSEAMAMAEWIQDQAKKGPIPLTWNEFYWAVQDYHANSPEAVTPELFNPNGSAKI
jgi:hypothetical protein